WFGSSLVKVVASGANVGSSNGRPSLAWTDLHARQGGTAVALAQLVVEDFGDDGAAGRRGLDGNDLQPHIEIPSAIADAIPDGLRLRGRHAPDLGVVAVGEAQRDPLSQRVERHDGGGRQGAYGELFIRRVVLAEVRIHAQPDQTDAAHTLRSRFQLG